jgi:hypothetical protein
LLLTIIECAAGMVSDLALPSRFWGVTGLSSAWLSWTMISVSLLLGVIALLSKYVSRVALSLVLIGNGILAFFWYFNGAYHNVTDDRTSGIHWAYEWGIEDPVDQVQEEYHPGSVSKHGAMYFPPSIGQNGTAYLLRQYAYTDPKGFSLEAYNPNWLWEIRPSGGICTVPVIADDGTVLFGTGADDGPIPTRVIYAGQGPAWAVSPEGKRKWTYQFPPTTFIPAGKFMNGGGDPAKTPACSQPAVAPDGTTYWLGHGVYALSSDGVLRWSFEPGENFYFVSIAEDGTVYALADGALFALSPDGTQKWKYSFERSNYIFEGKLAIGPDGTIYLTKIEASSGSILLALTPRGALKWRYQAYQFRGSTLVASDGTIYLEAQDHVSAYSTLVVALDPNGNTKWNTPIGSFPLAVASDGTLYICYIRDLFAISRRGNMIWKAQLPEDPDSYDYHVPTKAVTLSPNRKFYIGDFLGRLGTLGAPAGMATSGWPSRFHDARNTSRAGAH